MQTAPIITLTTDWGTSDFFAGMVKGRLYGLVPEARVVDITHEIPRGDMIKAAVIIRSACFAFPPDTIHLIDIGPSGPFVVIRSHDQYFVCCDNGLPHAVFGDECDAVVRVEVPSEDKYFLTFPVYSVFSMVARHLCVGTPLESLGVPVETLHPLRTMDFLEVENKLTVYVNYIDSYGNIDLSICYDQFEQVRKGRSFLLRVREYEMRRMSLSYTDDMDASGVRQAMLLTVSASGYLQLAMPGKSAMQYAGLRVMEHLYFTFF